MIDLSHVKVIEHASASYAPRTYVNAAADVTVAFAVDFTTAGEKLTEKAAGDKIVKVNLLTEAPIDAARKLWRRVNGTEAQSLNVAGNGIYTLGKHGWTQKKVNRYVYDVLRLVTDHSGIDKIVTGGQTGVDIAGAIAGAALGIETVVTFPKGLKQRYSNGTDYEHSVEEIMEQIRNGVEGLKC